MSKMTVPCDRQRTQAAQLQSSYFLSLGPQRNVTVSCKPHYVKPRIPIVLCLDSVGFWSPVIINAYLLASFV